MRLASLCLLHLFRFPNDGQAAFAAAAKEQLPRQWIVLVIEWLFNELRAISSPSRMVATWHHLRLTPWRYFALLC